MAEFVLALGGEDGNGFYFKTVDVFKVTDIGIEKIEDHGLELSEGRQSMAVASCGNYILALGGENNDGRYYNLVDVFKVTNSGVEHITDHGLTLSQARAFFTAASCGNYILAVGGYTTDGYSDVIDVFKVTDSNIEHITNHGLKLSKRRSDPAAASCGNYILAMGGYILHGCSNAIDVFQVR